MEDSFKLTDEEIERRMAVYYEEYNKLEGPEKERILPSVKAAAKWFADHVRDSKRFFIDVYGHMPTYEQIDVFEKKLGELVMCRMNDYKGVKEITLDTPNSYSDLYFAAKQAGFYESGFHMFPTGLHMYIYPDSTVIKHNPVGIKHEDMTPSLMELLSYEGVIYTSHQQESGKGGYAK